MAYLRNLKRMNQRDMTMMKPMTGQDLNPVTPPKIVIPCFTVFRQLRKYFTVPLNRQVVETI